MLALEVRTGKCNVIGALRLDDLDCMPVNREIIILCHLSRVANYCWNFYIIENINTSIPMTIKKLCL